MNAVWGQRIGLLMYDVCLPLPRSQALCVHRLQYEIRTVNEPRPSVWISYCKRRTHRAWERGYALPYTVCWTVIFLHFLKTHAGSAKAAIGKSGLTNAKLHNLQICIGLIPMPLPDLSPSLGVRLDMRTKRWNHHFTICRCYDKALGSWVGATEHSYQLHCSRAHWGYWGNEKTRYVHSLKPVPPVIPCSMLKEGLSLIPSLHASALSVVEWTACRMFYSESSNPFQL